MVEEAMLEGEGPVGKARGSGGGGEAAGRALRVLLARGYLESLGWAVREGAPAGFDLTARDGGTEVMVRVAGLADGEGEGELAGAARSPSLRRAALSAIADELPGSARVDVVGVGVEGRGRARLLHLVGACEWEC